MDLNSKNRYLVLAMVMEIQKDLQMVKQKEIMMDSSMVIAKDSLMVMQMVIQTETYLEILMEKPMVKQTD
jgi:hypothetical protein